MDKLPISLDEMRPWPEFTSMEKFSKPQGLHTLNDRIPPNLAYYKVNYSIIALVWLVLVLYFIPEFFYVLVLTIGSAAGLFVWKDAKIKDFELQMFHKFIAVFFVCVISIWFTDSMHAIYWITIPAAFAILAHAAVHLPAQKTVKEKLKDEVKKD